MVILQILLFHINIKLIHILRTMLTMLRLEYLERSNPTTVPWNGRHRTLALQLTKEPRITNQTCIHAMY